MALIGLLFILGGGWLCIPGRNHGLETLQSSCRLANAGMVHLYEGGGGDWYSVTVQSGFPWTEREVFWSSGSPVIAQITCEGDRLTISAEDGTWSYSAGDLVTLETPVKYYRGRPAPEFYSRGTWGAFEVVRTIVGASIFTLGVLALLRVRRLPNKPLERTGYAGRSTPGR